MYALLCLVRFVELMRLLFHTLRWVRLVAPMLVRKCNTFLSIRQTWFQYCKSSRFFFPYILAIVSLMHVYMPHCLAYHSGVINAWCVITLLISLFEIRYSHRCIPSDPHRNSLWWTNYAFNSTTFQHLWPNRQKWVFVSVKWFLSTFVLEFLLSCYIIRNNF